MVGLTGFEPVLQESNSCVLPLHYRALMVEKRNSTMYHILFECFNDLMELIKKLFGDNYEDVIIVYGYENEYNANDMTVKELKDYDVNKIDEIKAYKDKIYIYS